MYSLKKLRHVTTGEPSVLIDLRGKSYIYILNTSMMMKILVLANGMVLCIIGKLTK